ncbi:MAG TPA: phosphoenolpyruvate--protein phosphotransferase, partial [Acidimicrobiales bacterium]|nr:phosphoenolpyruvate--protein phosphotransferase [Acidimicrobiales bacterium]
ELRGDGGDCPIVLSEAPLVEGLVAAVALAAAGASLAEVAADAGQAGQIKVKLLGVAKPAATADPAATPALASIELALHNQHGLHARPAARFVETVRRFDADVTVRNLTTDGPSVSGRSVSALSTLGVPTGNQIEVTASGRQAREALAAVAALVRRNFDETVAAIGLAHDAKHRGPTAASPGIGIGPKTSLPGADAEPAADAEESTTIADTPLAELQRLRVAVEATRAELSSTREHVASAVGEHQAEIFDAHLLLLDDDQLVGAALDLIELTPVTAAHAWRHAVDALAARFAQLADPYLRTRADDVRAVGNQVLGHLLNPAGHASVPSRSPAGILVAADLTPTQAARLDPNEVLGIVTAAGSPLSHAAILARSLGIPAVVGAGDEVLAVPDGTSILVDGTEGIFVVGPDAKVTAKYRDRAARHRERADALLEASSRSAVTTDGIGVEVMANIASRDDAIEAVRHGADGVGLLRTEFLFLDRPDPPGEDEQYGVYLSIAEAIEGRRLTVRTLDVGGDKTVPYLAVAAEANPFLGCRGLRLSLQHTDIFKHQLRALVRAGLRHPITVLFPMVTTLDELRSARALLAEAAAEVGCPAGGLPPGFEVGAMAEVPAFALHARAAAPLVDLMSIGTNDLAQYTLAAERGNAGVAALADPLDPAVLFLISEVANAATARTRVAVCGEIASDPTAAALLIGLGVRELSMTPRAIPAVKDAIRSLSANKAKHLAALALHRDSAASVRALLGDLA